MVERNTDYRVPDPSERTIQTLMREIESLRMLAFQRIEGVEKVVEIAHDNLVRVPTDVQETVGNLKEMISERFNTIEEKFNTQAQKFVNIDTRLSERDIRNEQGRSAFSLSIAKSEANAIKQIDQLGALIQQNTKTADEKIGDLKDRLIRIEGTGKGRADAWGWVIAAGAVLVTVAIAVLKG